VRSPQDRQRLNTPTGAADDHGHWQSEGRSSTPRLFTGVIADLEAFRQQVEAQALEMSVQVQVREEKRSRSFDHAALVTVTFPALVFTALALPIQGVTTKGHDLPGWLILAIGLGSMLLGAIAGAAGSRWISKRGP
jgi:hypothetical protein